MVCRHVNVLRNQQIQAKAETNSPFLTSRRAPQRFLLRVYDGTAWPSTANHTLAETCAFVLHFQEIQDALGEHVISGSPPQTRGRIGTSPPDVLEVRRPLVQYYDDRARGQVHIVADRHVREFHGTCGC
jgi:hypothetical protein